jgi:CRP-like cAMP-binding protein
MVKQLQLRFVAYKKNSYIILEGDPNADRFFIIQEGMVRISKAVELAAEEGASLLAPGDFFAVVSTMSAHSRIETAQAMTDVTLISIHKEQYGELIQNNTAVAMKIIRQFSQRMRRLDGILARRTLKNSSEDGISQLLKVGQYYASIHQYNHAYYALSQYLKHCPEGGDFNTAREQMMKIAPYVKEARGESPPDAPTRRFARNTMIFSEGEKGDALYIIQKGSVKIVKIGDTNEILLAVLKGGDVFGEMALLESKPRTACALANEDCELLTVSRANFARMVTTQPQIIAKLTVLLAERIWLIYKQIANTLIEDPLGRMFDALMLQLEKARVNTELKQPFKFDFGLPELVNMIGLPPADGEIAMKKLLDSRKIQLVEGEKILALDVWEIAKQAQYYRRAIPKAGGK